MNDLNEFMATEVMGWTLGKSVHHIYQPSTWFENNIVKMNYKYWHPTEDMNQAMMCADKLELESITLMAIDMNGDYNVIMELINGKYYYGTSKTGRAEAICDAVRDVREGNDE